MDPVACIRDVLYICTREQPLDLWVVIGAGKGVDGRVIAQGTVKEKYN